jgi:uncharacterized protein YndB with AHSA1/START domain
MSRPRRIAFWGGLLFVGSVVGLICLKGYGATLPVGHTATGSALIAAPPAAVYSIVTTAERATEWRPGVDHVTVLGAASGRFRWVEDGEWGPITFEVLDFEAPRRFVSMVVDHPDFGGTWSWTFEAEGEGTRVTVVEDGEVFDPIFRVFTHHGDAASTINEVLGGLQAFVDPNRS